MENQAPQSWHSGCHGSSCLGSCFLTSASKEVWKAAWPPGVSQINHAFSQGPHPLRKTNRIMPSWGLFVPSTSPAPAQGASGKKEHQSYSPAWLHQETETSLHRGLSDLERGQVGIDCPLQWNPQSRFLSLLHPGTSTAAKPRQAISM